jgi:hypothetical protein
MLALLLAALFPVFAFANSNEPNDETLTPAAVEAEPQDQVTTSPALTPDGNLTLVDDVKQSGEGDKQFVTVVSKAGNYFYLVIDRAGDTENVYFLNLVDEADLMALIEDADGAGAAPPAVIEPQSETPTPPAAENPEPEKKGSNGGLIAAVLLLLLIGGAALYFFKLRKPKAKVSADVSDFDGFDFEDEPDEFLIQTELDEFGDDTDAEEPEDTEPETGSYNYAEDESAEDGGQEERE